MNAGRPAPGAGKGAEAEEIEGPGDCGSGDRTPVESVCGAMSDRLAVRARIRDYAAADYSP